MLALSLAVAGNGVQLWFLSRLQTLVATYGWGHVPHGQIGNTHWVLFASIALPISALVLSYSFLFTAMARARRIATEAGVTGYEFGFGWTVGSIFVPFWSLYRPWVGLAEIRDSIFGTLRDGRAGEAWRTERASDASWILAGTQIIGGVLAFAVSFGLRETTPHSAEAFSAWMAAQWQVMVLLLIIEVVLHITRIVYVVTLHRPLHDLVALADRGLQVDSR
jgi:uncharacterized membrane protein YhdT